VVDFVGTVERLVKGNIRVSEKQPPTQIRISYSGEFTKFLPLGSNACFVVKSHEDKSANDKEAAENVGDKKEANSILSRLAYSLERNHIIELAVPTMELLFLGLPSLEIDELRAWVVELVVFFEKKIAEGAFDEKKSQIAYNKAMDKHLDELGQDAGRIPPNELSEFSAGRIVISREDEPASDNDLFNSFMDEVSGALDSLLSAVGLKRKV